jgi:hypothetical protein
MTKNLEPQWIVGFVDGEGCFGLDVHRHLEMKYQIQVQPEFTVVQNEIDIQILHALKDFFNCGSVSVNRSDANGTRYMYRVKNLKAMNEKIIPFFDKHPLKTKRNIEYIRFREICQLMGKGVHTSSLEGLLTIVEKGEKLRERLNLGSPTLGSQLGVPYLGSPPPSKSPKQTPKANAPAPIAPLGACALYPFYLGSPTWGPLPQAKAPGTSPDRGFCLGLGTPGDRDSVKQVLVA